MYIWHLFSASIVLLLSLLSPIPPMLDAIGHASMAQIPLTDGAPITYRLSFSYRLLDSIFRFFKWFGVDSLHETSFVISLVFWSAVLYLFYVLAQFYKKYDSDINVRFALFLCFSVFLWTMPSKQFFWGVLPFELAVMSSILAVLFLSLKRPVWFSITCLMAIAFHPVGFIYLAGFISFVMVVVFNKDKLIWKYCLTGFALCLLVFIFNVLRFGQSAHTPFVVNESMYRRLKEIMDAAYDLNYMLPELKTDLLFKVLHMKWIVAVLSTYFIWILPLYFKAIRTNIGFKIFWSMGLFHTVVLYFFPAAYGKVGEWQIRTFFIHGFLIGGTLPFLFRSLRYRTLVYCLLVIPVISTSITWVRVGAEFQKMPALIETELKDFDSFLKVSFGDSLNTNRPVIRYEALGVLPKYGWVGRMGMSWMALYELKKGRVWVFPEWVWGDEHLSVQITKEGRSKMSQHVFCDVF